MCKTCCNMLRHISCVSSHVCMSNPVLCFACSWLQLYLFAVSVMMMFCMCRIAIMLLCVLMCSPNADVRANTCLSCCVPWHLCHSIAYCRVWLMQPFQQMYALTAVDDWLFCSQICFRQPCCTLIFPSIPTCTHAQTSCRRCVNLLVFLESCPSVDRIVLLLTILYATCYWLLCKCTMLVLVRANLCSFTCRPNEIADPKLWPVY
jgi:hypothetical protein